MIHTRRIYLDNAATSFPKPEAVSQAVDRYNRESGVAFGRGAYRAALDVQHSVDRCRHLAARLIGVENKDRVIFTFNGTDGLNVALHGLLEPGDHVVTSTLEHNSVRRPLREIQDRVGIEVSVVPPDATGRVEPEAVRRQMRANTTLVTLMHASNVTGALQPIADVGEIAHAGGALFLVDAAQSAGHIPIDLANLPVDLLACSGHKGLLGPLGTGLLYVRTGVEDRVRSFRQGGTGTQSEQDRQPADLPEKFEAGNHNTPGLIGLEAALDFLSQRTVEVVRRHEYELTARLLDGLAGVAGVEVFGPVERTQRLGVVSMQVRDLEPQVVAALLDENFGIECRAGLHCAPGAHQSIGTLERGGTVRLSTGAFTTAEEIDAAIAAIRELAGH